MPGDREPCMLDTSVLINFLAVDRVELLASHPGLCFLITPHVREEVAEHYPVQIERLRAALDRGVLASTRIDAPEELLLFARLLGDGAGFGGLGSGESAAIAAAVCRGHGLAIQDAAARNRAVKLRSGLTVITTEDVVVASIKAGSITVEAADALRGAWRDHHRFRIQADSFGDLL